MGWHREKVLVTGANGFSGTHLIEQLAVVGAQVAGLSRQTTSGRYVGDIRDQHYLQKIIQDFKPDFIFHLAGKIKTSIPQEYYQVNVEGTVALLEALRLTKISPKRIVIVSSSAVYEPTTGLEPIVESHPIIPRSHYGLSKKTQELTAQHYFRAYQFPVIICRSFNLVGPGLSSQLALSAFARQIARIEKTGQGDLRVGNLKTYRDFLDIRDAVDAYIRVAEHGRSGEVYNVCSGEGVTIQSCLDILLEKSRVKISVMNDPSLQQKTDLNFQVGANGKIRSEIDWHPQTPIQQSLKDLLTYWRNSHDD